MPYQGQVLFTFYIISNNFWFVNTFLKIFYIIFYDPNKIWTCDLSLRRRLLYPAELPDQKCGKQESNLKLFPPNEGAVPSAFPTNYLITF